MWLLFSPSSCWLGNDDARINFGSHLSKMVALSHQLCMAYLWNVTTFMWKRNKIVLFSTVFGGFKKKIKQLNLLQHECYYLLCLYSHHPGLESRKEQNTAKKGRKGKRIWALFQQINQMAKESLIQSCHESLSISPIIVIEILDRTLNLVPVISVFKSCFQHFLAFLTLDKWLKLLCLVILLSVIVRIWKKKKILANLYCMLCPGLSALYMLFHFIHFAICIWETNIVPIL